MLYQCQLLSTKHHTVKEHFYREGENAEEVKKGLELFEWGKGYWVITPENNEDEE